MAVDLTRIRGQLSAIGLFINEEFMLSLIARQDHLGGKPMLTATAKKPHAPHRPPAPIARRPSTRRFFRRRDIETAHRCLALHIFLAGPHSALE